MCWSTSTRTRTRLQAQIVDTIGAHHRVMAVGDDAQCIYSWRGANFENIMTFPDRHPGTVIHRIETNYRSTPEILNLANGVLMAQPKGRHFDKELRAARGHMEKPYIVQAMDDREQAEFIVKRVRALHEDEGVSLSEHRRPLPLALHRARDPDRAGPRRHPLPHHERREVLRAPAHPRPGRAAALRLQSRGRAGLGSGSPSSCRRSARRARRRSTPPPSRTRSDYQKNFLDALAAEDVRAKVPKDARDEWEKLAVSLKQVHDAMQDGQARRRGRDRDRRLVRRLPEGRLRRLRRPPRGPEGARRLRAALRGDAGLPGADPPSQQRDQRPPRRPRHPTP